MGRTKNLILVVLFMLSSGLSGCFYLEVRDNKTQKSDNRNVSSHSQMSRDEKCELADMVAKRVIELQKQQSEANSIPQEQQ